MTNEKAIEILKVAKAEIEWEYPLDYQIALDIAIKSIEDWNIAIQEIKENIIFTYPEHYAMIEEERLIDILRKRLKENFSNKCDTCVYKFETDGSNCYECVKGIQDNYEESQ